MSEFLIKLALGIVIGIIISKKQIEKIIKEWKGDK
jgi:uncharacterized protein YneF (UPF0154 family)